MNYVFHVLLGVIIISNCYTEMPSRIGRHNFAVLLNQRPDEANRMGLDKYTYTFYLLSSYEILNDYQIAFTASFPINVNFNLDQNIAYEFIADDFCLNFLIKNFMATLKGNLVLHHTHKPILTGTWIKIEEMLLVNPIDKLKPQLNIYYIMSNVSPSQMPTEIVLMKKLLHEDKTFYQLVKAQIDLIKKNQENSEIYLKIGTETEINLIDNTKTLGMTNDKEYSAILPLGVDINYYKFNKVTNIICLQGSGMTEKCSFIP